MKALIFALALANAYDVPVPYGVAVYEQAMTAGVNPFDMGSLLMAENKSRKYDPKTIGRHGAGGELGLYQLQPYPWSRVCDIEPADLKVASKNIACAAVVVRHMQESAGVNTTHPVWRMAIAFDDSEMLYAVTRRKTRTGIDWQASYRCHPQARTTANCRASINRVHMMYRLLVDTYAQKRTFGFWFKIALTAPTILTRAAQAITASPSHFRQITKGSDPHQDEQTPQAAQ